MAASLQVTCVSTANIGGVQLGEIGGCYRPFAVDSTVPMFENIYIYISGVFLLSSFLCVQKTSTSSSQATVLHGFFVDDFRNVRAN